MRSILLHIYEDECFEARFQVALDVARQCNGRITCAQAVPYDFGVPHDFYGTMSAEMIVEYQKVANEAREEIERDLENEGVSWSWARSNGCATGLIGRKAPLHDVVVVGAHDPLELPHSPSRFVGELTERVRAPIIAVPPDSRGLDLESPVVVAWNGAPESAHALRAAVPALSRASEVHILSVSEPKKKKKREATSELPSLTPAAYLALHDIKSEVAELKRVKGKSIAETLMVGAMARDAGYIVMGAYGHSRFRESVLGGVTRDMLCDPLLPLFLAH